MTLRGGVPAPKPLEWSELEGIGNQKLDPLTAGFAQIVDCQVALLCQRDRRQRPPVVVSSCGLREPREWATLARQGGFVDRALRAKRPVVGPVYPLLDWGLVHAYEPSIRYAVAAPVRAETGVRGSLIGGFATEPAHRAFTTWATESYAALFALYLNAPRALEGLLTELRTDSLTACLTYDGTRRELAREVNRATRGRLALSCCSIHVDGLERIEPPPAGEARSEILEVLAMALCDGVRSCDTVGRNGDEDFIAILPETAETEARQLAERLRTLLATQELDGLDGPITTSTGVATWSAGESAEQLLARAVGTRYPGGSTVRAHD